MSKADNKYIFEPRQNRLYRSFANKDRARAVWFIILFTEYAAILLFFCSKNSSLFNYQTGSDVNLYMDVGRAVSKGAVLYRDIFEQKGPFLLLLFSVLAKITPHSMISLYIIQSLSLGLSLYYLFLTSRLFLSEKASLWVCLVFPFFLLNYPIYQAGGGSPEELVLPCYMGGLYFLVHLFHEQNEAGPEKKTIKTSGFYIQGIFAGIVLLVKINLTVFFLAGCGMVFLLFLIKKEWRSFVKASACFSAGVLTAALPCIIYMFVTNSFFDFWSVYVRFNMIYASQTIKSENLSFIGAVVTAASLNLPAAMCAGYGFFAIRAKLINLTRFGELTYFLTCAGLVIMTYISGRSYHYYFIPILCFTGVGEIGFMMLWKKFWQSDKPRQKLHTSPLFRSYGIMAGMVLIIILCNSQIFDSPIMNNKKTGVEQIADTILTSWDAEGQKRDPSILLYNSGDLGYYDLTDTTPELRIFHMPHISSTTYPDFLNTQNMYIINGMPDYVICSGYREPIPVNISELNPTFELIDQQMQHIAGQDYYIVLYHKNNI
ncbi:MAG: hypothetical protein WCG21_01145 [Eubacteriales bacterium]